MKPHLADALTHLQSFTLALRAAHDQCACAEQAEELRTMMRLAELSRIKLSALAASTPHAG